MYYTRLSIGMILLCHIMGLLSVESASYQVHPIYGVRGAVRVNSILPQLSNDRYNYR